MDSSLCTASLSGNDLNAFQTGFEDAELLQQMMAGAVDTTSDRLETQPLAVELRESTDTMAIPFTRLRKGLVLRILSI
jgi:hypothetical protein